MKTMLAAVLTEYNEPLSLENIPIPLPAKDEVRLKVLAAGICSTDIHICEGKISAIKPPMVLGHEIVGEAESVGADVKNIKIGDRYIVGIDVIYGECQYYHSKRENLCSKRKRIGFERSGDFAQYVNVPAKNLVRCSDSMSITQAAILPDADACMLHTIVDQAKVHSGQTIVMIGLGGLGFHGVQIANHFGASVIATSRQKIKQDLGLKMGAKAVCQPSEEDIKACARELWGVETADVVIDIIGTSKTIATSLNLCKRGGKVIVVGYDTLDVPLNIYDLMLNEKEVIGARGSTLENLRSAAEMAEAGVLTSFVSDIYKFQDINLAMQQLQNGRIVGRAVVTMDE